jgi:glycosyltransferase involved in cell wall biosynthesis
MDIIRESLEPTRKIEIAIVIPTYYRKDGNTYQYLKRALKSIKDQTYKNYKIYLIGDNYEHPEEVEEIIEKLNISKITFENLSFAKERQKYTGRLLWSYGGVNAINHGISLALRENFEFICHLDHDDWWLENHLEEVYKCIIENKSDWVCTKSTFLNPYSFLPRITSDETYIPFLPRESSLIHSSVCMNFKKIPLFYRDVYEETGKIGLPADADLWERCRIFLQDNNLKSYFINKITCRHDEEGYSLKN